MALRAPIRSVVKSSPASPYILSLIQKEALEHQIEPKDLIDTIRCESNFNPDAVGDNGLSRGLSQIYRPAHPEITDDMAFSIEFAVNFMASEFQKGHQSLWSCWNNAHPQES